MPRYRKRESGPGPGRADVTTAPSTPSGRWGRSDHSHLSDGHELQNTGGDPAPSTWPVSGKARRNSGLLAPSLKSDTTTRDGRSQAHNVGNNWEMSGVAPPSSPHRGRPEPSGKDPHLLVLRSVELPGGLASCRHRPFEMKGRK